MIDVVVVGSGASGVNAAYPLVEAGLSVTMLDVGNRDEIYAPLIPERSFSEIRQSCEHQHRFLLGDRFEGIPFGRVRVGAQLTPPRLHITEGTDSLTPVDSSTFSAMESLAVGGLAAGWGANVAPFLGRDFEGMPIGEGDLKPHYEQVARRIGVSGGRDDLLDYLGDCEAMMPPLQIDAAGGAILERYEQNRGRINACGLRLGQARLAACSRPHRGRGGHPHHDMDFWSDPQRSVYRPQWTLEELQRFPNFHYHPLCFVQRFRETGPTQLRVEGLHMKDGRPVSVEARALILAAGTLGSARIVLRSLERYDSPVPLVCNPYTYAPMLNLNMLGRRVRDRRHSLSQLAGVMTGPKGSDPMQVQIYSYRSLLTFKLLKESFLPYRQGLEVMRALIPLFSIVGIHHADRPTPGKHAALVRAKDGGPDRLAIQYSLSADEQRTRNANERSLLRVLRRLRCLPIRRIDPGHGSSVHYAGTLPMSHRPGELQCDPQCRLGGARRVFLADGSVFPRLPAKGLTFSMMANANRVGTLVSEFLK